MKNGSDYAKEAVMMLAILAAAVLLAWSCAVDAGECDTLTDSGQSTLYLYGTDGELLTDGTEPLPGSRSRSTAGDKCLAWSQSQGPGKHKCKSPVMFSWTVTVPDCVPRLPSEPPPSEPPPIEGFAPIHNRVINPNPVELPRIISPDPIQRPEIEPLGANGGWIAPAHRYRSQADAEAAAARIIGDYPAAVITYQPKVKTADFTVPDVCVPTHDPDDPNVVTTTLQDRELLMDAWDRLATKAQGNGAGSGGILYIPWDVEVRQCDNLWLTRHPALLDGGFSIVGVVGPDGEIPRLECRSVGKDGVIPIEERTGDAIKLGSLGDEYPITIQSIEIDGYRNAISTPRQGVVSLIGLYLHHSEENGVSNSNLEAPGTLRTIICGSELSIGGKWNTRHIMYVHGGLHREAFHELILVDNVLHSASTSEIVKSLAQRNTFIGNRIRQTLPTDPDYERYFSQIMVSVMACAENRIEGNSFYVHKPAANEGGLHVIATRARMTKFYGCNRPHPTSAKFMSRDYWQALWDADKPVQFPTIVRNNVFYARPADLGEYEDHGHRFYPISVLGGTYPIDDRLGGFRPAALRSAPAWYDGDTQVNGWYERHKVITDNNVFVGFSNFYKGTVTNHCANVTDPDELAKCGPEPESAKLRTTDYFEIGNDIQY